MPRITGSYEASDDLVLGVRLNTRVPEVDQSRQRDEVVELLRRLREQPGVILADEVGMGKTFVALGVAYSVAVRSPRGPVIVMVPANLIDKWEQDLRTFCELYLEKRSPVRRESASRRDLTSPLALRFGVARHSIDLMKLLDDVPSERCHIIFLAQGAMARRQSDKWIRLALIAEALRRHGRGKASRLIQVKKQIHRFLAELLWAIGEERANDWGDELWQTLLRTDPRTWKDSYNDAVRDERRRLTDDPVPKSVVRSMDRIDLRPLAEALQRMPVRDRGGADRRSERLKVARKALRQVEEDLWKRLLAQARWRSPLLVMDEAHHLKNPGTALARQLQSTTSDGDLRTGDGAMSAAFDRMLFLTATPFQLGHHELVRVLERFGDVRWDSGVLGEVEAFKKRLLDLGGALTESQRAAVSLQRSWAKLRPEDCQGEAENWWGILLATPRESMTHHQRAVLDAYSVAKERRAAAEAALRPWIVRHNKGATWAHTNVARRLRLDGVGLVDEGASGGLPVPSNQLLPFFLAARSASSRSRELLGEALCSSFEAFRFTRERRVSGRDELEEVSEPEIDLSHSRWYLGEFDLALERCSGAAHPKIAATVSRVVELWEAGEKVLVFAFYRHTCRALRIHISRAIEERVKTAARQRLGEQGTADSRTLDQLLDRVQKRYFDDTRSRGRQALDRALEQILQSKSALLDTKGVTAEQRETIAGIMRKFLRVGTTLVRCFPLEELETIEPRDAVEQMLAHADMSRVSWRRKFEGFIEFVADGCSTDERGLYLDAASRTETGGIRVEGELEDDADANAGVITLPNVQVATGTTRRDTRARLMRAFNTPFFPDILVCSEVMGEGVDLQRFCRHVIHHDLAWNPSTIEQRTGRIDRLGCKAEGQHPIVVCLPYLAGTSDERQYQVMSDRERWFRVVMGQDEVARLITPDSTAFVPLPAAVAEELSFKLGL